MLKVNMQFQVISKTENGDLVVAQFVFRSDANQYIRVNGMPEGYHRIEKIIKCTCIDGDFMSMADCSIHGISEQLNRTQSE